MLNLFNLKQKSKTIKNSSQNVDIKSVKHFPSPVREWNNSIYVYNNNSINVIPSLTVSVTNIIKSYFDLYNKGLENKMRTKYIKLRLRKLSSNKIYISKGTFKHTNNKVMVNLYVFNRQKTNYLLVLKKWFLKNLLKSNLDRNVNSKIINRLRKISGKGIQTLILLHKDKYLLIKTLNTISKNKYNIHNFKLISQYTKDYYNILINRNLKKIRMYFYYKQLLLINKSKLNYTYLQYLKSHLESIFNKNVEFNITNLKKFYLNSDILYESILLKITRNRRKMLRYFKTFKDKIEVTKKQIFLAKSEVKEKSNTLENFNSKNSFLQNYILNRTKYKYVTGFRLEAKGRLNKRHTASRSISKLRYKGNLVNIDSSYKGISSLLLKGNLKSNVQYTKLKSKTRIGSFGIKGWVSAN